MALIPGLPMMMQPAMHSVFQQMFPSAPIPIQFPTISPAPALGAQITRVTPNAWVQDPTQNFQSTGMVEAQNLTQYSATEQWYAADD
jgi:hypothetical protein